MKSRFITRESRTPSGGERRAPTIDELRLAHTCSVDDAAAALGIGRSTAYAAARDGSLPTLRLSHRILVPTAKLLAMLGVEAADPDPHPDACGLPSATVSRHSSERR